MIYSSLSILYPPFRKALEEKLSTMPKDLHAIIFESYRPPTRQGEIYLSGHSRSRAWESWHQYGLAVDFVFLTYDGKITWDGDWDALGAHFKCDKIRWSWEWKHPYEKGHFEWRHDINIMDAKNVSTKDGQLAFWLQLDGVL